MYIEKNTTALQQLFARENIYLLKDDFVVIGEGINHGKELSAGTKTTASNSFIPSPKPKETTVQYYQPKQKVVIILTSLNPTDSELLGKILGAVKLDLQSVDIIELAKNKEVDLSQIFIQKSLNQVITFGIKWSELNLDVKLTPYQIFEKQAIKFIYSDSLSDIQNDIPKKKALWGSLKEMF
jgi:DNA polymerase III psi subunit